MKTYNDKKFIPLKIARKYLLNDFRAIKKISKYIIDYDDFPIMINGNKNINDEIKIECFADVPDSFVPKLLSEISVEENESFLVEMIYEEDDDSGVFPLDVDHELPESFIFSGEITESNVYVVRKEVINISKRWHLYVEKSALDTPVPDEAQEDINEVEHTSAKRTTDDSQDEYEENEKEDGRKSRHLKNKVELLEGAFLGAILYRDEFFDSNKKLTAKQIVIILNDHSATLWPGRKNDPDNSMPIRNAAERHISSLLNKIEGHNPKQPSNLRK